MKRLNFSGNVGTGAPDNNGMDIDRDLNKTPTPNAYKQTTSAAPPKVPSAFSAEKILDYVFRFQRPFPAATPKQHKELLPAMEAEIEIMKEMAGTVLDIPVEDIQAKEARLRLYKTYAGIK